MRVCLFFVLLLSGLPVWAAEANGRQACASYLREADADYFPTDFAEAISFEESSTLGVLYAQLRRRSTKRDHETIARETVRFLRARGVSATALPLTPTKRFFVRISTRSRINQRGRHWLARMAIALGQQGAEVGFDTGSAVFGFPAGYQTEEPMRVALSWDNLLASHLTPVGAHEVLHFHFSKSKFERLHQADAVVAFRNLSPVSFYLVPRKRLGEASLEQLYGKGFHSEEVDAYLKQNALSMAIAERQLRRLEEGRPSSATDSLAAVNSHLAAAEDALESSDLLRSVAHEAIRVAGRWSSPAPVLEQTGEDYAVRLKGVGEITVNAQEIDRWAAFLSSQNNRFKALAMTSADRHVRMDALQARAQALDSVSGLGFAPDAP